MHVDNDKTIYLNISRQHIEHLHVHVHVCMTHDRNTQETWCSLLIQQESKSISQRGDFFARIAQ